MINPSSAPKSPNPMPAGLGALTQMSPTPRGKSPSNMGQVMALARKMSDMQLADVLQGKSLDIPQFAAMTEAMGRKSLRNAMQGAEAQMQAKQPSVKDKLLAEEAAQQLPEASGIGQLPAPNMASMGMAGGGIIAFDDGGEVPRFSGVDTSLVDAFGSPTGMYDIKELTPDEKFAAALEQTRQMNARIAREAEKKVQTEKNLKGTNLAAPELNEKNQPVVVPPPLPPGGAAPNAAARPAGGSPVVTPGLPADLKFDPSEFDQKYKDLLGTTPAFNKRDNPYYSMKYEGDDPRKVREEGIGFGLMKAGQALLKNPTFAGGLGDAIGAFGDQGWLTAKELKAAKKDERDYNFNMAKATELFEQGQEDKALQYAKIGQDREKAVAELTLNAFKAKVDTFKANTDKFSAEQTAKYQKMMAGKPDSGIAMLNRIMQDNPKMNTLDAVNAMYGARTGVKQDTLSKDAASKLWEKMSKAEKKDYGDFENFYQTRNNRLLSDTIPSGAIRPYQ